MTEIERSIFDLRAQIDSTLITVCAVIPLFSQIRRGNDSFYFEPATQTQLINTEIAFINLRIPWKCDGIIISLPVGVKRGIFLGTKLSRRCPFRLRQLFYSFPSARKLSKDHISSLMDRIRALIDLIAVRRLVRYVERVWERWKLLASKELLVAEEARHITRT